MSPRSPSNPGGQESEELIAEVTDGLADLGRAVQEADSLGLGPYSREEARRQLKIVSTGTTKVIGSLLAIGESAAENRTLDIAAVQDCVVSLENQAVGLRRLLAPLNTRHLAGASLGGLTFALDQLPPVLLAVSRVSAVGPDLAGRLFMLASEYEFFGVLLSVVTNRPEDAERAETVALDRLRDELETLSSAGTAADIAVLRKRLNDALDDLETDDSALDEILQRIGDTSDQIETSRKDLDQLVAIAREQGASWNRIAHAVGISPQSAHKRWDPEARAKAKKYMQGYMAKKR